MELVGGKDNDEVLHSPCLGGRLLRPQKQGSVPVEAKLDEEMGELEDQVNPTISKTLPPPFLPILTKRFSAIFLIQM